MPRTVSWPSIMLPLIILFSTLTILPGQAEESEPFAPEQVKKTEPETIVAPSPDIQADGPTVEPITATASPEQADKTEPETIVALSPDIHVDGPAVELIPAASSITNYVSLTDLIVMVSKEAINQFNNFFEPYLVQVEPFPYLWEFEHRRPSMLGITLADQMAAVINNHTLGARSLRDQYQPAVDRGKATKQWVQGTLQEMDGHLRIHISARNLRGDRRSYVVNAEMSESIYRALHTVPYRSRLHPGNMRNPG